MGEVVEGAELRASRFRLVQIALRLFEQRRQLRQEARRALYRCDQVGRVPGVLGSTVPRFPGGPAAIFFNELDQTLYSLAEGLRVVTVLLYPYIPGTAQRLLAALGEPGLEYGAAEFGAASGGATTGALEPLFPKR